MPEFMFRNLSVKLYPAEGDVRQACQDRTTQLVVINCSPWQTACGCTQTCTGTYTPCQGLCTMDPSIPIFCDPTTRSGSYIGPHTEIVLPANADVRQELALLKRNLQRGLEAVEARQLAEKNAAKPASLEEIDSLKEQLLAAVAELDAQRAQMESGGATPGQR